VNITNDATMVSDSGTLTSPNGGTYTGSGTYRLQNNAIAALGDTQHLAKDFRLELGGTAPDPGAHLGGTFTLAGPGTLTWTGGQLEANLTVAHGATLDAEGVHANNGNRALDGRDYTAGGAPTAKLINHGTVKLGGGAIVTTWDAAEFDNESDGNLVIVPGSGFTSSSCCVNPAAIVNAGGVVSVIALPNAGTTATLDGVAYRATGGTTSIAGGRTLQLSGGATGLLSDTTVEGTGTLAVATPVMDAKTVTVNKQTMVSLRTSGSLNGTATLGGAGSFQWTGGSISGDLTVATGDATVSGTTDKVLATVNGGEQTSKLRFKAPTTFPANAFVDLD
jgi:fibronectin-binding autotransporter adhesin